MQEVRGLTHLHFIHTWLQRTAQLGIMLRWEKF